MGTGLSAGKLIYGQLAKSEQLAAIVAGNIYPLVIQEGVKFPFVTFSLEDVSPKNGHKFGNIDRVSLSVACVSDKYDQAVDASEAVRSALDMDDISFVSSQEDYQEGAFVKMLNFEIELEWAH